MLVLVQCDKKQNKKNINFMQKLTYLAELVATS